MLTLEQVTAQNPPLSQAYRNCQGETFDELLHHPNLHNEEFITASRRSLTYLNDATQPYLLQVVASALWETYEDEEEDPTQRRQLAGHLKCVKLSPLSP
ncbi:hypothetical protein PN36_00110 [Candidatus Thiomargarita nelsonii]|uniref:Uncharacterized protein n=1 Tax=Candidatus Thiomargarita nelsonii TaxID=1003181 RepID=A0A4E0QT21_9GAMM|nr:hypothetical protein PN36_00110 [Candidatus Thiomargarita nelsonii]